MEDTFFPEHFHQVIHISGDEPIPPDIGHLSIHPGQKIVECFDPVILRIRQLVHRLGNQAIDVPIDKDTASEDNHSDEDFRSQPLTGRFVGEGGLKGKVVGINVREGMYNGNPYTQIGRLESADDVRKGLVETMKPKAASGDAAEPAGTDPGTGYFVASEEVPF